MRNHLTFEVFFEHQTIYEHDSFEFFFFFIMSFIKWLNN